MSAPQEKSGRVGRSPNRQWVPLKSPLQWVVGEPTRLALVMIVLALVGLGGAALSDSKSHLADFITGTLDSAGLLFLGIAVGLWLVDPVTRRYLEQAKRRAWSTTGDAALVFTASSLQTIVLQTALPLYQYLVDKNGVRAAYPQPNELAYWAVRTNPKVFIETAGKMLEVVGETTNTEDPEKFGVLPELGKHMVDLGTGESIARSLERLRDGANMYRSLPVTDTEAFDAVTRSQIAAGEYEDALWAATGIHTLAKSKTSEDLCLGMISVGAHRLAESSLVAYARIQAQRDAGSS